MGHHSRRPQAGLFLGRRRSNKIGLSLRLTGKMQPLGPRKDGKSANAGCASANRKCELSGRVLQAPVSPSVSLSWNAQTVGGKKEEIQDERFNVRVGR